jgi:hypothetical protein
LRPCRRVRGIVIEGAAGVFVVVFFFFVVVVVFIRTGALAARL